MRERLWLRAGRIVPRGWCTVEINLPGFLHLPFTEVKDMLKILWWIRERFLLQWLLGTVVKLGLLGL